MNRPEPVTVREEFESAAARWDVTGRPGDGLLSGWHLLALYCWSTSPGGKHDGMSPVLREFATVCYRCAAAGPTAANGNPACRCGGELVG